MVKEIDNKSMQKLLDIVILSCENGSECVQFVNEFDDKSMQKFLTMVRLSTRLTNLSSWTTVAEKFLNKQKQHRRFEMTRSCCNAVQDMMQVKSSRLHGPILLRTRSRQTLKFWIATLRLLVVQQCQSKFNAAEMLLEIRACRVLQVKFQTFVWVCSTVIFNS